MLYNEVTGQIKSWGYCDFPEEEGHVVEASPVEILPQKKTRGEEYFYIKEKIEIREVPIKLTEIELLTQRVSDLEKTLTKQR